MISELSAQCTAKEDLQEKGGGLQSNEGSLPQEGRTKRPYPECEFPTGPHLRKRLRAEGVHALMVPDAAGSHSFRENKPGGVGQRP